MTAPDGGGNGFPPSNDPPKSFGLYTIDELLTSAKAQVRGLIARVGTELGTDIDINVNAAVRLFQGAQVAAAHVHDQLDLRATADADRRDSLVDQMGIVFAKPATTARGLVAFVRSGGFGGPLFVPAGYVIDFPGTAFVDGVPRSYRTTQDFTHVPGVFPSTAYVLASGSSLRKLRVRVADGVTKLQGRALLLVAQDNGTTTCAVVSKGVNAEDQSVDLYAPLTGTLQHTVTEVIQLYELNAVVEVEAVEPGSVGNAGRVIVLFDPSTTAPDGVMLIETGGGGESVGDIDGDTERVVRVIEDTLAMPPGFGNAQHWREIALACPDVDIDDAVVYQDVRGPGTIDIVCIGRSGSIRSSSFPGANLSFCGWGNNARRVGDAAVEIIQAWCSSQASYFDDILVRGVEWDWRGNTLANADTAAFMSAVCAVDVVVTAQSGYEPDCGASIDVTPALRHPTNLYSDTPGVPIDDRLDVGQRVWVTVGPSTTDGHHAFATVVTTILSVDHDRMYVTVADLTAIAPPTSSWDSTYYYALRWGSAGPLTQPCLDAVFGYFDRLGPGSYTEPPRGPSYVQHFSSAASPSLPGHALTRWPPEGRRWGSGLRATELRAELLAVPGVQSVEISPAGSPGELVDFDATPMQTLALSGCVVRAA